MPVRPERVDFIAPPIDSQVLHRRSAIFVVRAALGRAAGESRHRGSRGVRGPRRGRTRTRGGVRRRRVAHAAHGVWSGDARQVRQGTRTTVRSAGTVGFSTGPSKRRRKPTLPVTFSRSLYRSLLCPPKDGAEIFERLGGMTPSCLKRPLTRAGKRWKAKEEAMDREAETVPEETEDFKFARQQHPAVESTNLEQRDLDCVRTRGADGFSGRVVDSRAESALGCSDRSGGDCDAQLLFPIVPFRLAQLAFRARTLEIGSTAGVADTCICNRISGWQR